MRSACTLLALAGLGQAKVFLFNAENCNTNFDNYKNYDFVSEATFSFFSLSFFFFPFFFSKCSLAYAIQTPHPRAVHPASKQKFHGNQSVCACPLCVVTWVEKTGEAPTFLRTHLQNFSRLHSSCFFACSLAVRSTRPSILKTCGPATKPPKMLRSQLRTTPKSQSLSVSTQVSRFFVSSWHLAQTLYSTLYTLRSALPSAID